MELSQTREDIHHNKNFTFTPVRLQEECSPRVLFKQGDQLKEACLEMSRPALQTTGSQQISEMS